MIGGATLSHDEQRIVDWLEEEYRSSDTLPVDSRHMLSVVKRCIEAGDHRTIRSLSPSPSPVDHEGRAREIAHSIIQAANDGYHGRDDYPPFALDSMSDRRRWSEYIEKVAAVVLVKALSEGTGR